MRLTDAGPRPRSPWAWRTDWRDKVSQTSIVGLEGQFAFVCATPYAAPGTSMIMVPATDPGGAESATHTASSGTMPLRTAPER